LIVEAFAVVTEEFCDVTPCGMVDIYGHFGGTCYLHLQGREVSPRGIFFMSLFCG